jgi:hypothetical protein
MRRSVYYLLRMVTEFEMRILYCIIGGLLLSGATIMMLADPDTYMWWPVVQWSALAIGVIFLNRAMTGKPLYGSESPLRVLATRGVSKRPSGVVGLLLLSCPVLIPLLGSDRYFGYNATHQDIMTSASLGLGIVGAVFLGRYLYSLRESH